MDQWDVIVVGAGVAGMTAAALLAHEGARVLLLEGHDKPGGCAGYYEAAGFTFDVGATVLNGTEPGDLHAWVFDKLGVTLAVDELPGLHVHLPDREVRVARDTGLWRSERRAAFPRVADAAERFWRRQERVADALWRVLARQPSLPLQNLQDVWRTLRAAWPPPTWLYPYLNKTVGDVLAGTPMQENVAFRAFLDMLLLITVQETSDNAAYLNGCAAIDVYRHGMYCARGGMRALCEALIGAFQRDGGEVRFKKRVVSIKPEGGRYSVTTKGGETLRAEKVIANVPIWNLGGLLGAEAACGLHLEKLEGHAGEGWGAGVMYLGIDESVIPHELWPHHQVLQSYEGPQEDGNSVFISLSLPGDTATAPPGRRTLNVSTHTRVGPWFGIPREEHATKKAALREQMMAGVRHVLPDIDEGIVYETVGTPAMWQVYTQRRHGQVGGVRGTPGRVNLNALSSRIGLNNFWLVGDTTFPGQGTLACTLSGINAWKDAR